MFMFNTVPAEAVVPQKRVATSVVHLVGKACDNIANVLWRNKGAVAIGTTAVAVATNPEPFVQGAAAAVAGTTDAALKSSVGNSIVSYVLLPLLLIAGVWVFLKFIGFKFKGLFRYWRVAALVLAVLLMFSGAAHAGVLECAAICPPLWWTDIIGIVLLLVALFL